MIIVKSGRSEFIRIKYFRKSTLLLIIKENINFYIAISLNFVAIESHNFSGFY